MDSEKSIKPFNEEKEKQKLFEYIDKNINLCNLDDKINILTKIISEIGLSKIQVASDGSNIFLDDLPLNLLKDIKKFIEEGNIKNKIDFSDINNDG
jgi:hypothetical protein